MRSDQTGAERKLWRCLRSGQLNGFKFRRQHPVPPYVADFYCEALRLVVELDGSQHTGALDAVRTRALETQGLAVLRFWDNDVLTRTEAVVEAIFAFACNRTLTPTPLPAGEGL
jgi:very-short-patch-repair endonuclease